MLPDFICSLLPTDFLKRKMADAAVDSPQGKVFKAVVLPDPLTNVEDGETISFRAGKIRGLPQNAVNFIDDPRNFGGSLLSIHVAGDGSHQVDGTAVMVAPGIAISARHVIEPYMDRLAKGESYGVCCTLIGDGLQIWKIHKITIVGECDLAILGLILGTPMPKSRSFVYAAITTRMPRLGEPLSIVGLRALETNTKKVGKHYSSELTFASLVSAGVVSNQYPGGRDRAMLPWPVLEVACPTWGGMSGGPVFDERGFLVGLLCSSVLGEDGSGTSYVSMIWPVLTTKFEGGWPANYFSKPTTLLELDARVCSIERPEAVTYSTDSATGITTTNYASWDLV